MQKLALTLLATAFMQVPLATAQDVPWRAVIGSSGSITVPGLPAGNRSFTDFAISDAGKGYAGVRMTGPDTAAGYWALRQGNWTQYVKNGVTGAAMGPGRTGAEAGHVFHTYITDQGYAGADGQRAFAARAGAPGDTTNATYGVWRWDTTKNIEIARVLTDGALGPNLGADWTFDNSSDFVTPRSMNRGQVLLNTNVNTPTGLVRRYLAKSVPGEGIVPCAMRYSTEPALAPGIVAGDSFDTAWGMNSNLSVTSDNRVYLVATTNQSRDGIWEVCDGAPRARAVDNETNTVGTRGPDIGIATATFVGFESVHPADDDRFYFFATYRPAPDDSSRTGLFWNDGTTNRPLAMNDVANVYGPGWQNATWSYFSVNTLTSAGAWTAFQATIYVPADGATPDGLWRVEAGGTPELVALLDIPGSYGPEAGRTWDSFYGNTVLANGDIIVEARTQPGSEYALWQLKKNAAPRRILKIGQSVSVPTSTGVQQAAVTGYTIASGAHPYSRGADGWIASDSSMLIEATLNGYSGRILISGMTGNPLDRIFAYDFEH
jgi:hypothetical protein